MGTVVEGLNEETGERAAVKILAPSLAADEAFRLRFSAEIQTLQRLHHPNIVRLFGYGEQAGWVFYAMELVEGTSLQDELQHGRRYDWREVTRIAIEICKALKHAHDHGVIHRDLKPANLLINSEMHVRLSDFGIAKFFGSSGLTADGGVLGTADYMAPEQAEGRPVTARSDLYSLGCVMYALLAGKPPFTGQSIVEVLHKVRYEKPLPLSRTASDTPRALEEIIFQLLEKDPERRFRSPSALAKTLAAMQHALTLRAEDPADSEDDELRLAEPIRPPSGPEVTHIASTDHPAKVPTGPTRVPPPASEPISSQATAKDRDDHAALTDSPKPAAAHRATASGSSGGTDHFTVVEPAKPRENDDDWRSEPDAASSWFPTALGSLALVLVIAALVLAFRPASADSLYDRIATASAKSESEGDRKSLLDVTEDVDQFLVLYGADTRADEVRRHQAEIKQERLARKLQRQVRGLSSSEALSPVGRIYRDAMALESTEPDIAVERLQALVAVFGSLQETPTDDAREVVELARRQLDRLAPIAAELEKKQREAVLARLAEADEIATTEPKAAAAIRQGIVTLYGRKAWARDLIERAQKGLKK